MIFKVLVNFLCAALSGDTVLISVMSQQYNCLMALYTNFTKFSLFMKMHLPSTFILRYVRAPGGGGGGHSTMSVHSTTKKTRKKGTFCR